MHVINTKQLIYQMTWPIILESKIVQRNVNDIAKTQQVVITFLTKKSHEDADLRKLLMNMMFSIRKIQLLVPNIVVCTLINSYKAIIIISTVVIHLYLSMFLFQFQKMGILLLFWLLLSLPSSSF